MGLFEKKYKLNKSEIIRLKRLFSSNDPEVLKTGATAMLNYLDTFKLPKEKTTIDELDKDDVFYFSHDTSTNENESVYKVKRRNGNTLNLQYVDYIKYSNTGFSGQKYVAVTTIEILKQRVKKFMYMEK